MRRRRQYTNEEAAAIAARWIALNQHKIMSKLSQLATTLGHLTDEIGSIKTNVDAIKASLAANTDVELPPEAQAALDTLSSQVDALNVDVAPTTTTTTTTPAPVTTTSTTTTDTTTPAPADTSATTTPAPATGSTPSA